MTTILTQLSDAVSGVIAGVAPSIVRIEGTRRSPVTGFAWSADLVVTAAHAIRRRDGISVARDDGESSTATLVGVDYGTDIALLRVEDNTLKPISWTSRETRAGDFVVLAGRPGRSVRTGIGVASAVGGEWRTHNGSRIDRFIDVDASLPRGFSGGPLLDGEGACIGMNTSHVAPGGTTIPRATLQRVVDDLLQHGSVPRPLLGIGVYPVEEGLLVMSVKEESSAAKGGILVGDIIKKAGGKEVHSPRELHQILLDAKVGSEFEIELRRGGEAKKIRVNLAPSA